MPDISEKLEGLDIRPAGLVEEVARTLTEAIIEGKLKEGDRLVEGRLQERFGISRSPIREALRGLEKDGFVEMVPRKGAFVRKVSGKDVQENFPIRACLEGFAAKLAAPLLSRDDLDRMERCLSSMEEAIRERDYQAYLRHHIDFHEVFIDACGNDTLIRILEQSSRRQAMWFRSSYFYIRNFPDNTIEMHRDILDRLSERDPEGAERSVNSNILTALDAFMKQIRS